MFKLVLAFAAISAVVMADADVPEAANRFLAVTRTSTSILLSTTTIPTTVAKTCYTTNAALTACRRRRNVEEQPIIFKDGKESVLAAIEPTQTLFVEPTAFQAAPLAQDAVEILGSANEELTALDNGLARAAFGITIYYTTTSTISITQYSTATSGSKVFTLDGCSPVGFAYSAC